MHNSAGKIKKQATDLRTQVLLINKHIGQTPLEVIQQVRKHFPAYQHSKIGYAGRLDPMAEGLLLLLVGQENKKRVNYESLAKEYVFEILFGVATDTYDALGKVTAASEVPAKKLLEQRLNKLFPEFLGRQEQAYPPYSSRTVNGKPLFYWARKNMLDQITIPSKRIIINNLHLKKLYSLSSQTVQKTIYNRLRLVKGNFRQKEIEAEWQAYFSTHTGLSMHIAQCSISCSSGTYVRSIAHTIALVLGGNGIALSIRRERVGNFRIEDAINLV